MDPAFEGLLAPEESPKESVDRGRPAGTWEGPGKVMPLIDMGRRAPGPVCAVVAGHEGEGGSPAGYGEGS